MKRWGALARGGTLLVLLAVLVLACLPSGVILRFAPGPGEIRRVSFAYFSLTPYGYAAIFPLPTAVLTACVTPLSALQLFRRFRFRWLRNATVAGTAAAALFAVLSATGFGSDGVTGIGVAIAVLLPLALALQLPACFARGA